MTIIIGLRNEDGFVLGSDTLICDGYIKYEVPNKTKWKRYGKMWIGWSGLESIAYAFDNFDRCIITDDGGDYIYHLFKEFRNYCIENNIIRIDENKADSESMAMIIHQNKCYILYDDLIPQLSILEYSVVGSGSEMALGCLYGTKHINDDWYRVWLTINCCGKHSEKCNGIGKIFQIDKNGDIV